MGWHLQRTGHVLVDRSKPGAGDREEDGAARRRGHSLIVFPEGTRSTDGASRRSRGLVRDRARRRLPIVPLSIVGSRHVMFKGS
jgi:1-acyl-sn-glycerol-3-phosphate acyltransferase